MLFKSFSVIVLLTLIMASAIGQERGPYGRFEEDSMKVGEPITYILTYNHKSDLEVFFPDSTYDFSPFEYVSKEFFPTRSDSLGSFDSVAYTLASYEIDKTQYLSVPVYLPGKEKPVKLFAEMDSIALSEVIQVMPDSVKAYTDTNLIAVNKQFNYPDLLMWSVVVIILLLFIYMLFGEKIRKYIKIRNLKKRNIKFILEFDKLIYGGSTNPKIVEEALVYWKTYAGKLMEIPLASYTTTDISKFVPEKRLTTSLKAIDRAIYAGISDEKMKDHLVYLKDYASIKYNSKIKFINGKDEDSEIVADFKNQWSEKTKSSENTEVISLNGQEADKENEEPAKKHFLYSKNILTHSIKYGIFGFILLQLAAIPLNFMEIDGDTENYILFGCMGLVFLLVPFLASNLWLKNFKYIKKYGIIRRIVFRTIFFTFFFFFVEYFVVIPLYEGEFNSAILFISLWASVVIAGATTFVASFLTYLILKGKYKENQVVRQKRRF